MRTYKPKPKVEKICKCGCTRTFWTNNDRRVFFSDYCQLKNMYRNRKEQLTVDIVAQQFSQGIRRAYSQLTYEKFCEVIGEKPVINGKDNTYADDKWENFRSMCACMSNLGTHLDKIVEFGLKDERAQTA